MRLCLFSSHSQDNVFQSTHPHGVRHKSDKSSFLVIVFQSTHPHGVRLNKGVVTLDAVTVSIHAPTWGATVVESLASDILLFQSTHPHGVRPYLESLVRKVFNVSIHAPTWGATRLCRLLRTKTNGFNPRTHMGCDWSQIPIGDSQACFNPRTHMGCDIKNPSSYITLQCFNPRTHMGCDTLLLTCCSRSKFQSTHPHGVRLTPTTRMVSSKVFQSTHPHGVRPRLRGQGRSDSQVSIHAPTWGATAAKARCLAGGEFQSTHPHGVRRSKPSTGT